MATTPPPLPVWGPRLAVTEKMVRSALFTAGITGGLSADLTAICNAVKMLEGETPQKKTSAQALSRAWNKWLSGHHPGELSVATKTQEFKDIYDFVSRHPVSGAAGPRPVPGTPDSTLKSIAVGLFSVKNRNANFTLNLGQRMQRLHDALDSLSRWMGTLDANKMQQDNAFHGIFLAPEYYWTRQSGTGSREFLDANAKDALLVQLKALSKSYPKILIVPGTIHYDVQLDAKGKIEAGYQLLKAAKDRILREEALTDPKSVLNASMNHQPTGINSKVASMNEMADNLLNKNTSLKKVHNVTYLLLDGKIFATYDKHADFYEAKSISPSQSVFIPGTQDECPLVGDATRKFRFGVEICFDHGNGVLKRRSPHNLHFHLVVSDHVPNQPANMAMTNTGYFLHAATDRDTSAVYRKLANGQLEDQTVSMCAGGVMFGPDFLDVYALPLPHAV